MLKPLLRTIPTLSGNVKIACSLSDYNSIDAHTFETNVRYARLLPLSHKLYQKHILANLLGSSYEFDLKKFYDAYNDSFYNNCFDYNKEDMTMLDLASSQYQRNVDFEFGCKRISWEKNGAQFAFFAPIWVESEDDIPNSFTICIDFSTGIYKTTKKIKVNIRDNKDFRGNYLYKYLSKYASQLDDNVIFMLPETTQATYYGIDLIHGGFVKAADNLIKTLFDNQTPIHNFDCTINYGFKRNKMAIKQILPLAFYFNVDDILTGAEKSRYKFAQMIVSGYYSDKNDTIQQMFDFSFNYDQFDQSIYRMSKETGLMHWVNGYAENIMDVKFPSLNEKRLIDYQFSNKLSIMYNRWKLKYSSDEHPYITNLSWAFNKNQDSNYKYGLYPSMYTGIPGIANPIKNRDGEYRYNLIYPLGENIEKYDSYNTRISRRYEDIYNNYCLNWFNIIPNNFYTGWEQNTSWSDVKDDRAYFNGVLYELGSVYNKLPQGFEKLDKFGVFFTAEQNILDNNQLNQLKYANNVILRTSKFMTNSNCIANDNLLYYQFGNFNDCKNDTERHNEEQNAIRYSYISNHQKPLNYIYEAEEGATLYDNEVKFNQIFKQQDKLVENRYVCYYTTPDGLPVSYVYNSYELDANGNVLFEEDAFGHVLPVHKVDDKGMRMSYVVTPTYMAYSVHIPYVKKFDAGPEDSSLCSSYYGTYVADQSAVFMDIEDLKMDYYELNKYFDYDEFSSYVDNVRENLSSRDESTILSYINNFCGIKTDSLLFSDALYLTLNQPIFKAQETVIQGFEMLPIHTGYMLADKHTIVQQIGEYTTYDENNQPVINPIYDTISYLNRIEIPEGLVYTDTAYVFGNFLWQVRPDDPINNSHITYDAKPVAKNINGTLYELTYHYVYDLKKEWYNITSSKGSRNTYAFYRPGFDSSWMSTYLSSSYYNDIDMTIESEEPRPAIEVPSYIFISNNPKIETYFTSKKNEIYSYPFYLEQRPIAAPSANLGTTANKPADIASYLYVDPIFINLYYSDQEDPMKKKCGFVNSMRPELSYISIGNEEYLYTTYGLTFYRKGEFVKNTVLSQFEYASITPQEIYSFANRDDDNKYFFDNGDIDKNAIAYLASYVNTIKSVAGRMIRENTYDIDEYEFEPVVNANGINYARNVFIKRTPNTSRFYGETLDYYDKPYDKNVLWCDLYNMTALYKKYNLNLLNLEKFDQYNSGEFYAKFLNKDHLYFYYAELCRDKDLNWPEEWTGKWSDHIYIKKRRLVFDETATNSGILKLGIKDQYIPISRYRNLLPEHVNISLAFKQFFEDVIYDLNSGLFYFKNYEEDKFEICYKSTFIRLNQEMYEDMIKLMSINDSDYKDIYIYRVYMPVEFEQDYADDIWKIEYMNRDTPLYKEGEVLNTDCCLVPLFNNVFEQEKKETLIYAHYILHSLTETEITGTPDGIPDKNYRYNANSVNHMIELTSSEIAHYSELIGQALMLADPNDEELPEEYKPYFREDADSIGVANITDPTYNWLLADDEIRAEYNKNRVIWYKPSLMEYLTGYRFHSQLYYLYESCSLSFSQEFDELKYMDKESIGNFENENINICTIKGVDGLNYGFYLIKLKFDNTSNSFNIIGQINNSTSTYRDYDYISNIKNITFINGHDITLEPQYMNNVLAQTIPFMNVNPITCFNTIPIVVKPSMFNIPTRFGQNMIDNTNGSNEISLFYYNTYTRQGLSRYLNSITPWIIPTNIIYDQYNLKFKNVKQVLTETGKFNSIGDSVIYPSSIKIDTYHPLQVYGVNNTYNEVKSKSYHVKNYNMLIDKFEPLEYKHYNCSKIINLPDKMEYQVNRKLVYDDLRELESEENTLKIFSQLVNNSRKTKFTESEILFLYKKYSVEYSSVPDGLNAAQNIKLYTLTYKFSLL